MGISTATVIPVMESHTTPSGIASASSEINTSRQAWRAFNGQININQTWMSSSVASWLAYEFPSEKLIVRYSFRGGGINSSTAPKTWTFEGSNDGTNWTVLDTKLNQTIGGYTNEYFYDIPNNTKKFKKYRFNITAVQSSTANAEIMTLSMYELYNDKILLSSSNGVYSLKDSSVYKLSIDSEENFLSYGADSITSFNGYLTKLKDIKNTSTALGSGKTFEHTIDMSKRRVDKITLG
ncbi:hypothetical protein IFU39_17020 [Paenibacillus sp. CFBP 13594]|uniref:hypothetical protein n=1 Tax=Paenibacillus sp. CFBP 13594 TaxID=2774037 RepID=UPI00178256E0|nr:hypothetical protein [Paenibacillus sp. CFBP 13594]MBD8839516.1 hypothetical protein [Paenibacillus sp. CFBP 13594]